MYYLIFEIILLFGICTSTPILGRRDPIGNVPDPIDWQAVGVDHQSSMALTAKADKMHTAAHHTKGKALILAAATSKRPFDQAHSGSLARIGDRRQKHAEKFSDLAYEYGRRVNQRVAGVPLAPAPYAAHAEVMHDIKKQDKQHRTDAKILWANRQMARAHVKQGFRNVQKAAVYHTEGSRLWKAGDKATGARYAHKAATKLVAAATPRKGPYLPPRKPNKKSL